MDYTTDPTTYELYTATDTAGGGIPAVLWVTYFAVIVLMLVAMWKVFAKAGKPGWASIIPIYNTLVLLQIVRRPWWWILLLLIPVVNLVFLVIVYNDVAKTFGKGVGFTAGLILLPIVFWPMLAFGSATYKAPASRK